ncbi:MAG: hypothetical protein LBN39_03905 [Planctomycetaceae bacterium]|nr:hypothetical protein [Planctomycetaceae bacterium]
MLSETNIFRQAMPWLLTAAVMLPAGCVFLFAFARLFAMFGDPVSSAVLDWTAFAAVLLWFLSLIALLFCTAAVLLNGKAEYSEEE